MDAVVDSGTAASGYLPTASEVTRAMQWLRSNPGLALGMVVGLTGFSVVKYYSLVEEAGVEHLRLETERRQDESQDDENNKSSAPTPEEEEDEHYFTSLREATKYAIDRVRLSVTDTEASFGESPGSSTTDIGPKSGRMLAARIGSCSQHLQSLALSSPTATAMPRACSFCNSPASGSCCDPDWGWFVPTGPADDELTHHLLHHQHHNHQHHRQEDMPQSS